VATAVKHVMFQEQVWEVSPGMIGVRFDGTNVKWLTAAEAKKEIRKVEDCGTHGWREMRPQDILPDRVVKAGSTHTDGDVFAACNSQGEPGKMNVDSTEEGTRRLKHIWCPLGQAADQGHALVLYPRFVARWESIKAGDELPTGAVAAKAAPEGQEALEVAFVARVDKEAGKLTVVDGRVLKLQTHHGGIADEGEVLLVEEVASELEVEIISVRDLKEPNWRPFDNMRKSVHRMKREGSLAPYVKVKFGEAQEEWKSTCRRMKIGEKQLLFGERAHFGVRRDEAPPTSLTLKVKDERHVTLVGDPTIGTATIEGDQLAIVEAQTVELLHEGSVAGQLKVKLRWHGGRPGSF